MSTSNSGVVELSLPLPRSLDTRIYIRLSTQTKAVVVSLTTSTQDELGVSKPMGSLVYALPNRYDAQQPLATALFPSESTLEFTMRMAKLLARKSSLPVYVTNSVSFENSGMGGTIEEEMEAFKAIADAIVARLKDATDESLAVNGAISSDA